MATGKIQKPSFDLNSFPQPQNIISNTDFNNMVQSGVYLMTGGMTNSPFGGGYGMLIVLCNDYSSSSSQHKVRQIFIPESVDSVFIRRKYTGAWTNWEQLNATITSPSTTKSSNVTGEVSADRAGHVFNIRIDITFSTVGGGWNEVATLPFSPSHNYYGVVSTTGGACKLAIVTYTGKVQILAPSANTEYLGTITGIAG